MIQLSDSPAEGSAIVITVHFKDFDDVDFVPITCVWSLTDSRGNIVNSRDRVAVTPSAATHDFVISGDDILFSVNRGKRVFTVEGTYTSTYGAGMPFREEASFTCRDTVRNPLP